MRSFLVTTSFSLHDTIVQMEALWGAISDEMYDLSLHIYLPTYLKCSLPFEKHFHRSASYRCVKDEMLPFRQYV